MIDVTIWELLEHCVGQLDEPFRRSEIIGWFRRHHPEVLESSLGVHIQGATAEAPDRGQFASRAPLLERVDRGLYCRAASSDQPSPRASPEPDRPVSRSELKSSYEPIAVLVDCVKSKRATAARAADLYTSELFRRRRAYAEVRALPWFILSAEYGLLRPGTVVAPYDCALADQPTGYRTAWGSWVAVKLDQELGDLTGQRLEVHAGSAYVDALREPLRQCSSALDAPLQGLRLGEQLEWYDKYRTRGTDVSDVGEGPGMRRRSQVSKGGAMAKYGRDDLEWDRLADAGLEILIECARGGGTTDYTSLSEAISERTGLPRFDFDRPDERAAMGHLLGLIVERSFGTSGFMISALVLYAGGSDAGSGFYALAVDMGLLSRNASRKVKEEFWIKQVNGLYSHYAREGVG